MRSFLRARPHLLAAALCAGLAAANGLRDSSLAVALAAIVLGVGAVAASSGLRLPVLALALLLAGWWWGSARLDALDRSVLLPKAETAGQALVAVTGPARRSRYELRVPAQVRRFRDEVVREPVLLRLPPGRSPPQGALLDVIGEIKIPRGSKNGFDERTWLRRHVVLRATRWRVVGRRGGLAGFADGLRARLARSMAPGLGGERRAVLAGIVLGEDEGLSDELRARFRASGLYHLLAVSGQNVALIAGGGLVSGLARRAVEAVRPARGAGCYWRLRARGRVAAVCRAGGHRGRTGLARVVGLASAGSLVLPTPRRGDPLGLESVFAARRRLPALICGSRRDLRRGPAAGAQPHRLSGAAIARGGGRCLVGLRARDRADPAHTVRLGAHLFDPRKRAGGARRRTSARARPDHGTGRARSRSTRGRARLDERLVGRLSRRVRPARRRTAVRGRFTPNGARGHRPDDCPRAPRGAPSAATGAASGRARADAGPGRRRLAASGGRGRTPTAERLADHLP